MNMNTVFNMFTRMVMQRAMNWGINKGMGKMSRGKGTPPVAGQAGQRRPNRTADLAKKMRTLSRLTRR